MVAPPLHEADAVAQYGRSDRFKQVAAEIACRKTITGSATTLGKSRLSPQW